MPMMVIVMEGLKGLENFEGLEGLESWNELESWNGSEGWKAPKDLEGFEFSGGVEVWRVYWV